MAEDHTLGDAPIEDRYREQLEAVARGLDLVFNGDDRGATRKIGFVLLMFEYGEHNGRANFISNGADRKDIVTLFREMIARFEGQPEVKGHG
jgi:hypothetical protein